MYVVILNFRLRSTLSKTEYFNCKKIIHYDEDLYDIIFVTN